MLVYQRVNLYSCRRKFRVVDEKIEVRRADGWLSVGEGGFLDRFIPSTEIWPGCVKRVTHIKTINSNRSRDSKLRFMISWSGGYNPFLDLRPFGILLVFFCRTKSLRLRCIKQGVFGGPEGLLLVRFYCYSWDFCYKFFNLGLDIAYPWTASANMALSEKMVPQAPMGLSPWSPFSSLIWLFFVTSLDTPTQRLMFVFFFACKLTMNKVPVQQVIQGWWHTEHGTRDGDRRVAAIIMSWLHPHHIPCKIAGLVSHDSWVWVSHRLQFHSR